VIEPIRRELELAAVPDRVFALLTTELGAWWPPEYTWSQAALEHIEIEPQEGGRCYERGPHGFHLDWGRVLACTPGERLVFTWQIAPDRTPAPDPARASVVEVRRGAAGAGATRLELEHRGFERHGEAGADYRAGLDSEPGWTFMLGRLAGRAR
jgi:uncharacterized protein YndB with AHSA1/START domain